VPDPKSERFLTTVLFTDIVGSTEVAAQLGDSGWRDLVQEHHKLVRAGLRRHGGRELDTAGDGFFAVFDAPASAAECALDVIGGVQALGIQIRAGLHVGEVEKIGAKVGGITVPISARIMAAAGPSEVLASSTVRDLAAGSGLTFEDRGERELKGVPGDWRLFAVTRTPRDAEAARPALSETEKQRAGRRAAAVRRLQARPFWQRHPRATAGAALGLALVVGTAGALVWSPWRPPALASVTENAVGVIDPGRNQIVRETKVEDQPAAIAVGEGSVWVANSGSNTVSRIDSNTHAVVDSIDVGKVPAGVAVGNGAVWVADSGERSVTRINAATNRVVSSIPVGNGPTAIVYGAGAIWVANTIDGTITRIDPASGQTGPAISVGSLPGSLAIDAGGLWVVSQDGATVSHLDPSTGASLSAPIPVGSRPAAVAIGAGSVWVANAADGSISRIDPAADRVIGVVNVGGTPVGLAVVGTTIWVADATGAIERVDVDALSASPTRIMTASAPGAIAVVGEEVWFASRASAASHRGGTIRVVSRDPISLDPNAVSLPLLQSLIGDALVGYRRIGGIAGSQLIPDLATSIPKPTEAGLTYTFHLRPGIVYSDGTPVRPSDFKFALERVFQVADPLAGNLGGSYYQALLGADACQNAPVKRCDLSRAIVVDDAARIVTFHLATPDPDFLFKLGLGFAYPIRAGSVPADSLIARPSPGTGPYMVSAVTATTIQLVRNPHFHSWDAQVRPDGFADEIVWTWGIDPAEQVKMVESGAADYMADQIPADSFSTLETQYTPQLHLALQKTTFVFMNTKLPPFDKLAVRQAVSLAVDRAEVARLRGGSQVASITCQILPPNFPGYEPYCPYTKDPAPDGRGPWKVPDLEAARKLVADSGTANIKIVVGPFVPRLTPIGAYMATVLREIGYLNVTQEVATDSSQVFKAIGDKRVQMGAFEYFQDYPAADTFLGGFTCNESDGLSNYCDPSLDQLVREARDLQTTDPAAAEQKWAEVDRKVTDLALWCTLVNEGSYFVSARLANSQYDASYGILLDQAWVK
jgi:YVTN family beta-propeller protein